MKQLKKYDLAFLPTMIYVKKTLEDSNTLSEILLASIDFEAGQFFVYLPENIEASDLYNFGNGGVSSNSYREIAHIIFENIQENTNVSCIIDDVIRSPSDKNIGSFGAVNLFHQDEVYHLITYSLAKVENILKCLHETDALWHSLCILTEADFISVDSSELTKEKIKEACLKTKVVIVGAYDGEGYVFWKPLEPSKSPST